MNHAVPAGRWEVGVVLYYDTLVLLCNHNDVFFSFRLVTLAFAGSIGMTLVILGCALPDYK